MATKNNEDYKDCVTFCNATFPNNPEALKTCMEGCAKVNAPTEKAVGFATEVAQVKAKVQAEVQKLGKFLNEEIESLEG